MFLHQEVVAWSSLVTGIISVVGACGEEFIKERKEKKKKKPHNSLATTSKASSASRLVYRINKRLRVIHKQPRDRETELERKKVIAMQW